MTHRGPFQPLLFCDSVILWFCQKRISCDHDLSFFLYGSGIDAGVGRLNLGDTSKLDEPSFSSLFDSTCRASYLLCKGKWECGVVTEEMRLLCWVGACHHCPHPLSHCVLLGGERIGNPPYHASCLPYRPVPGMVRCASSGPSLRFADTSQPIHLLPELCP